jgi:hypothetical protein
MARRAAPATPERPILSVDQKRRCIERLERCIHELEKFDPTKVQKRSGVPEVLVLETAIDEALSAAFGHGTIEYKRYVGAARLDHGPLTVGPLYVGRGPMPNYAAQEVEKARRYFAEGKAQSLLS